MDISALNDDAFLAPLKAVGYEAPSCITCGDVAVEVEIIDVEPEGVADTARVRASDGGTEVIDISLVQPVHLGDRVMAHARMAITRLSS